MSVVQTIDDAVASYKFIDAKIDAQFSVSCMAYDPHTERLAVTVTETAGHERIDVLSTQGIPELLSSIRPPNGDGMRVQCFTRGGRLLYMTPGGLVSSGLDGGEDVVLPLGPPGGACELPDGRLLLGGYRLRLWEDGAPLREFEDKVPVSARHVGVSPSGRFAFSAGDEPYVRLWDVASGAQARRLAIRGGFVSCAAFSPDGTTLAYGGGVNKKSSAAEAVRLLNVDKKWSEGGALALPDGPMVGGLCFSADGERLCVSQHRRGHSDGAISVWDWRAGVCLHTIQIPAGTSRRYASEVAISADGRRVIVYLCPDARVLVFETP